MWGPYETGTVLVQFAGGLLAQLWETGAQWWGRAASPRVPRAWKQLTPRLLSSVETKM